MVSHNIISSRIAYITWETTDQVSPRWSVFCIRTWIGKKCVHVPFVIISYSYYGYQPMETSRMHCSELVNCQSHGVKNHYVIVKRDLV